MQRTSIIKGFSDPRCPDDHEQVMPAGHRHPANDNIFILACQKVSYILKVYRMLRWKSPLKCWTIPAKPGIVPALVGCLGG